MGVSEGVCVGRDLAVRWAVVCGGVVRVCGVTVSDLSGGGFSPHVRVLVMVVGVGDGCCRARSRPSRRAARIVWLAAVFAVGGDVADAGVGGCL